MTDEEIRMLIAETYKDLEVFSTAKHLIVNRINDLEPDSQGYERFTRWAGTQAALNVLIMCEVRCRGLIEDLSNNVKKGADVIHLVEDKDA